MLQFVTTLGSVAFATELRTVVIASDSDTLRLKVEVDGAEVLAETYHPDATGTLRVYALDEVVRGAAASPVADVVMTAETDWDAEPAVLAATVVECRAMPSMSAAVWLPRAFLTATMTAVKRTAVGRRERLHVWVEDGIPDLVMTVWRMSPDGQVTQSSETLTPPAGTGRVWSIDWVPGTGDGEAAGGVTFRAVAVQGLRRMQWDVDTRPDRHLVEVRCSNVFGLDDWVAFTGISETELEADIASGRIGGRYVNYDPAAYQRVTLHSGWLSPSERLPYATMLLSPAMEVELPSGTMLPVVVEEVAIEHDDDDASMVNYAITVRPAEDVLVADGMRLARVFDATFDQTFE